MIWLLLFLLIAALIFCYLFFAPFYLEINSKIGLFRVRFHRLASAGLHVTESSLTLDLKIAGWRKQIDLFAERPLKEVYVKKEFKKESNYFPLEKIQAIIKSFKVNKFYLSLCFDNMPLNGIAYPVFRWLSVKTGKNFEINFWNENEIAFELENNFFRIVRAYIKS